MSRLQWGSWGFDGPGEVFGACPARSQRAGCSSSSGGGDMPYRTAIFPTMFQPFASKDIWLRAQHTLLSTTWRFGPSHRTTWSVASSRKRTDLAEMRIIIEDYWDKILTLYNVYIYIYWWNITHAYIWDALRIESMTFCLWFAPASWVRRTFTLKAFAVSLCIARTQLDGGGSMNWRNCNAHSLCKKQSASKCLMLLDVARIFQYRYAQQWSKRRSLVNDQWLLTVVQCWQCSSCFLPLWQHFVKLQAAANCSLWLLAETGTWAAHDMSECHFHPFSASWYIVAPHHVGRLGHQLLRCPLGSAVGELIEVKGGPWQSVQIQSPQVRMMTPSVLQRLFGFVGIMMDHGVPYTYTYPRVMTLWCFRLSGFWRPDSGPDRNFGLHVEWVCWTMNGIRLHCFAATVKVHTAYLGFKVDGFFAFLTCFRPFTHCVIYVVAVEVITL